MNRLKSLWKEPGKTFEKVLYEKINWFQVILLFSANGIIIMYYIAKRQGAINIETFISTIASIFAILTLGSFYGVISNLLLGYLITITGKFWNATNDLKKIYVALSQAFLPSVIMVYCIIVNILIAHIINTGIETVWIFILSFIFMMSLILQSVLGIWQLILIVKGLKLAQNISTTEAIINYISASIIFGIFYYFLISPYL